MQKSKLLETIKCLSSQELTRLEQFLLSPFFRTEVLEQPVLDLLKYIIQYQPDFDHPDLDRVRVYAHVYPNSPIVKGRLEKAMTRLLKEVRRYIVVEQRLIQTREADEHLLLIRFFKARGNYEEFERIMSHARSSLQEMVVKDEDYYLDMFRLEETYSTHLVWFNDRKTDFNLEPTLEALNTYYVNTHFEYLILHLSKARTVLVGHSTQFLEEQLVESLMAKLPMEQLPMLVIQYKAYKLLLSRPANPDLFLAFTHLLEEKGHLIPLEKLKDFQALARNYCISEFNKGNEAFFQITFDMYKLHLRKGYLYRNGLIHATILKNLVSMGLRVNEQDWVVQFLTDHRHLITGLTFPEEAYHFNMAVCHFYVGAFDEALSLLSYNYDDLFYKIAAKRLEIKVLFETESQILDSRLEAFNILIFRMGGKQLSEIYIIGNKRFAAYLRRIMHPSTLHNAKRSDKIRAELINESTTVVEKEWLLDILNRNQSLKMSKLTR
jgi:hypothetical protein